MNMRERIARALAAQEGYAYDPEPYDARADAVLNAMREPTEAMIKRYDGPMGEAEWGLRQNRDEFVATAWRAMIDAAKADA